MDDEDDTSEKQKNANRNNSTKSTGPRTTRGKAVASLNALIHGILAKRTVATGPPLLEDPAEFVVLLESLRASWNPVGVAEDLKVQEIASVQWRRVRLERFETAGINDRAVQAVVGESSRNVDEKFDAVQKGFGLGSARDPSTLPQVTAEQLRAQMDLVEQLHSNEAAIEADPEFLTFVYFEKCDLTGDPTDPGRSKLDQIRDAMKALTDTDRKDLIDRFVSQSELVLREFWQLRAKSISQEAAIERSLIPDDADLAKIMRYSTHLRREELKIIAMLEAMQAARRAKQKNPGNSGA